MTSGLLALNDFDSLCNRFQSAQQDFFDLYSQPAALTARPASFWTDIKRRIDTNMSAACGKKLNSALNTLSESEYESIVAGIESALSDARDAMTQMTPAQVATAGQTAQVMTQASKDARAIAQNYQATQTYGPQSTGIADSIASYVTNLFGGTGAPAKQASQPSGGGFFSTLWSDITGGSPAEVGIFGPTKPVTPAQKTSSSFSTLYPASPTSPRPSDAGALLPIMTSSGTTKVESAVAPSYPHSSFEDLAKLQKQDSDAAKSDWATIGAGVAAGLAPSLVSMFSPGKGKLTGQAAIDAKKAKLMGNRGGAPAPSKGMSTTTIVMIAGIAVLVLGVAGVGVYSATKKKD